MEDRRTKLTSVTTDRPRLAAVATEPAPTPSALYAEARRYDTAARNMVDERLDGRVPAGEKADHRKRERELRARVAECRAKAEELEAAERPATEPTPSVSPAWEALQAVLAGTEEDGLATALAEYGRVSAYTAGPDATRLVVQVAGRTIRLDLAPDAVEALTLAAYSTAEDMIRESGLTAPATPVPAVTATPIVRRSALSVLPGGAA